MEKFKSKFVACMNNFLFLPGLHHSIGTTVWTLKAAHTDPAENIFHFLLPWWFWYSTINIFCKNGDIWPIFWTGPFTSFVLSVYCMYNTSVFIATFCLRSSWWYQTWSSLFLRLLLGEKPVCSVRSSAKAAGLGKCCSLLPQTEAVLFCDYSWISTAPVTAQLKSRASLLYRECYLTC